MYSGNIFFYITKTINFHLFLNQGYDENNMFVIDWAAMFDDENQGKNFLM